MSRYPRTVDDGEPVPVPEHSEHGVTHQCGRFLVWEVADAPQGVRGEVG